jgi:hypothetical protein
MHATTKALKSIITQLVAEKVALTRSRVGHKQAPPEEKQTAAYRSWFGPVDDQRSDLKHEIRHHLLAYAIMRGRPYKSVENHCADDNKPSAYTMDRILEAHEDSADDPMWNTAAWLEGVIEEEPTEAIEVAA